MPVDDDLYWREALQLESADLVKRIYQKIHGRELNTTRARQVVAAFLQGREYYRNAALADIAVKPLLLFYGVSSLSRCLTLLSKREGGEETLPQSHGLGCTGWSNILDTDVEASLARLGDLPVESSAGLFTELLISTENRSYLHVRSGAPDWNISFDTPTLPITVSFDDVLKRIPDLKKQYTLWTDQLPLVLTINDIATTEGTLEIKTHNQGNLTDILAYTEGRVVMSDEADLKKLVIAQDDLPLFVNTYVEKAFGAIPNFYMASPFPNSVYLAQIPLTFVLSYYLGMLCRYFPSHWMALCRGSRGDKSWPLVQVSLHYIKTAFPQLLMEFIEQRSSKNPDQNCSEQG